MNHEAENDILRAALHRIIACCGDTREHGLPAIVAIARMALEGRPDRVENYTVDALRYRTLRALGYVKLDKDGLAFWSGSLGHTAFKDLKNIVKKCETGVATSYAMIDRFTDYLGEQARTVPSKP